MRFKTRYKMIAARVSKEEFDKLETVSRSISERKSQFIRNAVNGRIADFETVKNKSKNA